MVKAHQKRWAVSYAKEQGCSERRACGLLHLPRPTYRYELKQPKKDSALLERIKDLALRFPRFGYPRITVMLNQGEERINIKRVHRLWKQENLAVPARKRRYKRKYQAEKWQVVASKPNQVWSYDFIHDRLTNGRMVKFLCVVDEYTRQCLAIEVEPSMRAKQVIQVLERCFKAYGAPQYLRSDNGSEFTARATLIWLGRFHTKTTFIDPGKPWQNGYVESFHSKLRDECLNMNVFRTGEEAKLIIEQWRQFYNQQRPHTRLNNLPPERFIQSLEQVA